MASSGREKVDAPKRSMSGWKASKPGAFSSKESLLSGARHRSSSPDINATAEAAKRRSLFLTSRPGTMVGKSLSPESARRVTASSDKRSQDGGDVLGTSPLDKEIREERERFGDGAISGIGQVEKSEKKEEMEGGGSSGDVLARGQNDDTLSSAEEKSNGEETRIVMDTKRGSFIMSDNYSDPVEAPESGRGIDDEEETASPTATADDNTEIETEESIAGQIHMPAMKGESVTVGEGEEREQSTRQRNPENGSEENSGDSNIGERTQSEAEELASVSSVDGKRDNFGTTDGVTDSKASNATVNTEILETKGTARNSRDNDTVKQCVSGNASRLDKLRGIERDASAKSIALRPLDSIKRKEGRPFSDLVDVAIRVHESDSKASRRGTEITAVAPASRSFCSSSSQKVIINSTGQKREHSLKSATVLGLNDGRNEGLSSILRRNTVSQADPFPFSAPLPSAMGVAEEEQIFRKGRSGTVSVSPVDYHQSQQQFWFASDDVCSSPDSAVPSVQPMSRMRNETFVMPIICSIGAIPPSSLLKNPMIAELRTQFSEAHGITNMHTMHVYEAFHFMKQLAEVSAWLEKVLAEKAPRLGHLEAALEDGTLLCELANRVKSGVATPVPLGSGGSAAEEFGKIENVARFLAACEGHFGIDRQDLFCEADVIEKKSMIKVVHGLHVLAKKSQSFNDELPEMVEIEEGARDAYDPKMVEMAATYVTKLLRHHMAPLEQT